MRMTRDVVELLRRSRGCLCCGRVGDALARVYVRKEAVEVYCGDCPVGYDETGYRVVVEHVHGRSEAVGA